jgi:hypothetical protein
MLHVLVQEAADQECRQQPDRSVHEEDPAPADRGRDDAADGRPHHGGSAPNAREQALDPGSLLALEDVARDGECDGLNRPGAETLNRAEDNQLSHRTREAAQHRSADEQRQTGQEDRLSAVHVGQSRVERDGDGGGEQVGRKDPAVFGETAEIPDDGGHRGRDDGRIESRDGQGRHDSDGYDELLRRHPDPAGDRVMTALARNRGGR